MISLQSCTVNDNSQDVVDNDTISEVLEYTNVDFVPNAYTVFLDFPHTIFASDMVLVYRLSGVSGGQDVWKLQPENFFFPDGTLDYGYNFDFTQNDVKLYMIGNDLQTVPSQFRLNQIFRVVIIPGYFGKMAKNGKNTQAPIDYTNYNEVVKAFHINESKIQKIN